MKKSCSRRNRSRNKLVRQPTEYARGYSADTHGPVEVLLWILFRRICRSASQVFTLRLCTIVSGIALDTDNGIDHLLIHAMRRTSSLPFNRAQRSPQYQAQGL